MAQAGGYELRVVQGQEAGTVLPLEGTPILLARRGTGSASEDVRLEFAEPTVSAVHAVLVWCGDERVYRMSNRSPFRPATVDGEAAYESCLRPGVRIQLGELVAEVHLVPDFDWDDAPPRATQPAGYHWEPPPEAEESEEEPGHVMAPPTPPMPDVRAFAQTPTRAPAPPPPPPPPPAPEDAPLVGFLQIVKGHPVGHKFAVQQRRTVMGRASDCDVCVEGGQISRHHAAIEWDGPRAILVPLSTSSGTRLNRKPVTDRVRLSPEDEVTLADRVVLRWIIR